MRILCLLRHGQSKFNKRKIYTGRKNVALSDKGIKEAKTVANIFSRRNIFFSKIYSSPLIRALHTARIIKEHSENKPDVITNDSIIARSYGILEGLKKKFAKEKYGKTRVFNWKRGYGSAAPSGESLADACDRTWPFLEDVILKELEAETNILLVSHGNTLRSIVMKLENISEDDIVNLEIPNCIPNIYFFNEQREVQEKIIISEN